MNYIVAGEKYLWLFNAPNKKKGRRIANYILFFERIGTDGVVSSFSQETGCWEAKALGRINQEVLAEILNKVDPKKIIEIKRRREPEIDVLYVTRLQTERQEKK